jgi:predicted nucleic acid-binding protein
MAECASLVAKGTAESRLMTADRRLFRAAKGKPAAVQLLQQAGTLH